MKKITMAISSILIATAMNAQVKMPAPSPTQTIKQDFALGSIEIKYSRPAAKGRKVFGDLVPFNKLWRTGANAATLIKFTDAVEIKGKRIDTGSYALYTIPGTDSWEVILNKGVSNWGIDGYKESEDVVRFRVESMKMKDKVENFTMQFADIKPESCELQIMWEKTGISIPVNATIKDRMRAQIEAAMQSDKKPYFQAAQFYSDYDKNAAKALEYASKAVEENPKAFWIWIFKARLEKETGNKKAAMESSKKSLELAKEAKNDDYVKMNEELQKTLR
jgi:tetratricopeptide (TPR) repeat protein